MGTGAQPRSNTTARSAILASSDLSFRQRLRDSLTSLRWQVREVAGGAEVLASLEDCPAEAVIVDSWLPDLEIREFVAEFGNLYPDVDLIMADASIPARSGMRSPRRNEVLHALRCAQAADDGAAWNSAPRLEQDRRSTAHLSEEPVFHPAERPASQPQVSKAETRKSASFPTGESLPEFIGLHSSVLEISRRIRLVAPRDTSVLVQGPTGSGKELVARAVHRLSSRAARKLVALNCAAIPEALLEAELFGHTRGAFTGAVQGRTGRIEAAHGGTLFLDEVGEMPLALQAKLLRFLETGELQRVGDNEPVRVDVRIIAASHRPLGRLASEGAFRADLYYRLAVFIIRTPALAGRTADIEALTMHFLRRMGERDPAKRITSKALEYLQGHDWPGNVRELEHVVERAWILAEDRPFIDVDEIEIEEFD